jgi:pyridoxal phosphate enzyme (YggS family)
MDAQLQDRLRRITDEIRQSCISAGRPENSARLVAVTKTVELARIQQVIDLGMKEIGENRVQEICEKIPRLTGAPTVHLIGHLQSNKVAKVVPLVDWIQSVDSVALFRKIEQHCLQLKRKLKILVQVNTSGEESKSGCSPQDAAELCGIVAASQAVEFRGLMTIGPLQGGEAATRASFVRLRELRDCLPHAARLELSMGMSGDFRWAIEEGATIVRVGSSIFGKRV